MKPSRRAVRHALGHRVMTLSPPQREILLCALTLALEHHVLIVLQYVELVRLKDTAENRRTLADARTAIEGIGLLMEDIRG